MVAQILGSIGALFGVVLYIGTRRYKKRIERELIQLSDALEAQLMGKTMQPFSELDDELMSKIQKQLMGLEDLWLERYAYEKKERERLNSLISDISHQIKTPLANIKLYDSLIETEGLDKDAKNQFSQKKEQQMNKLEWLMEALIKVSKMETGIIQFHKKRQELSTVLLQAIDMVTLKAEKNANQITFQVSEAVQVDIDGKWIAEAIFNLLDNAVKYSPRGSQIEVGVEVLELFVRVTIEDEAKQIAQEEYPNLFKRFYRMDETAEVEGVGLGLYMSRDIVQRHEGYIVVEEGTVGNRFSVFLPRALTS